MTQKEAALEIGVDQGTLARWERNEREPTGAMLDAITRFLAGDRRQRMGVPRAG